MDILVSLFLKLFFFWAILTVFEVAIIHSMKVSTFKYIKVLKFLEISYVIFTISSKKSPTSISSGWIAFLFSWNCFENMIQLNQIKIIKKLKKYFWSRSFLVLSISGANIEIIKKYIQEQGGKNEDS